MHVIVIVIVHFDVCLRLWASRDHVYLIISFVLSPAFSKNIVHSKRLINV